MEKENINGIQVDVSVVLANKVAELAVATISQDKLDEIGRKAWFEITKDNSDNWNKRPSEVNKLAASKFYEQVSKYLDELMSSEEYQKKAKEEAENIIVEMKQKIHDNLVNTVAGQLSNEWVSPYGGQFKMNVEQIVLSMIQNSRR